MRLHMKNNLFPAHMHQIATFFWTGDGAEEMQCRLEQVSKGRFVVNVKGPA
jgi:hypothetical protein